MDKLKYKYIVIKQSVEGRVYICHIDEDKELGAHISACFEHTEESILSVTKVYL